MKNFGPFLSNLRSSAGLSLEELSRLVDSSKSSLSRLENNQVPQPFKGPVRKLVITLAEILCTSKSETKRYLELAGIDQSLLSEAEQIQVGFAPAIPSGTPEETISLERAERIYKQFLTQLEAKKMVLQDNHPSPNLSLKIQEYVNALQELQEKLNRLYNQRELKANLQLTPLSTADAGVITLTDLSDQQQNTHASDGQAREFSVRDREITRARTDFYDRIATLPQHESLYSPEQISLLFTNNLLENQEFLARLSLSISQSFIKAISETSGQSESIPGYRRSNSSHLNEDLVAFFESVMLTQWNSYYTGGTKRVVHGLNVFLKELENLAQIAQRTVWQSRVLRLLTLGYQLQNCVLRDRLNYPQAHIAYQKAFNIAQELEDDELIASALARQGVALTQQSKPKQAMLYLDNALNIVGTRNLPKLKGYTLQALSEANAQDKRAYESRSYLGKAEAITVQPTQEQSLIRFNPTSTLAQKGVDAVFLGEYKSAVESIDQSLKSYDPTGISGRARLIAMKAEAHYEMGTLDACVSDAQEALILAQAIGSSKIVIRIKNLHTHLQQSPWKEDNSLVQLGTMLYSPSTEIT